MIVALYDELRRIAGREYRRAGAPATIEPTMLVSEAYLKLAAHHEWVSREHFLGHAATAIRHVLIDAARARASAKRGGGAAPVTRDVSSLAVIEDADLLRLGDALATLGKQDARLALLVDCRFFAGLDEVETAAVLGVTDRTVRRWWLQARAYIHREMEA